MSIETPAFMLMTGDLQSSLEQVDHLPGIDNLTKLLNDKGRLTLEMNDDVPFFAFGLYMDD
ncbi:hypothetical protein [Paenibacillus ihumii]|uniref:hypothetical protein n=1 Tax=Paenibacillus ihumii TaxID=687436 RepID=UPI0006D857AD|nr:hypothetical protein [Paenibacillus ihumii]